ncbi:MAG: F0F1 ATP synthase subunit delta [Candidatus Saccharimonas sp.]
MSNLPESISSPSDITGLILEVRSYAQWYGQYVNAQRAGSRYKSAQPELSDIAGEVIRTWAKEAPLTAERIDEHISNLEHIQKTAPVITITLAAAATAEVKRALVTWCRAHIHEEILVTFRFNATILGGMVVRYGSRVYDWSFRRAIMSERQRFPEVLSRV